ncbi:ABC transporter permease [Dyadobacter sp. CY326]|uniref:ABC transporter permease n=1 Tax=Dyadobacter sp. CY326 TaxID=2907300 RepID=UPI001F2B078E|nr:ABC transporter permease [Dyadobacter sp. CY326]MCE7066624.1 ABC transporter permease [Dyadobacter sp. CY326]
MIRNYFKVAVRNLRSGGWYSALNIGGLAVVLAVSLLLFWWVQDELSFDRFHADAERIYQVNAHFGKGEDEYTSTSTPGPIAVAAQSQVPEVETAVRMGDYPSATFRVNDKTFAEKDNLAYADTNFLDVFNGFKVLYGNKEAPFSAPNAVVISEKLAQKFFGTTDAIGKTFINVESNATFIVSAVLKNAPDNSSFIRDMYVNLAILKTLDPQKGGRSVDENWEDYGFGTYVKLAAHADPLTVAKKLTLIQANAHKDAANPSDFQLQPLTEIHLYSVEGNESAASQVGIMGAVALFLLSIGCINYVNLTTARATRRSKEIGIRKVVGAGSKQLAIQLLVESLLTLSLALILSIALLQGFLPFYRSITGKSGHFSLFDPHAWQLLFGALTFCFLLAGIYPAFLISGFNPIKALKGRSTQASGAMLRKSLVVAQFALATMLIVGTFVIGSQMRFIRERDPGFDRKHTFTFDGRDFTPQIKQALSQESSVLGVSTSTDTPVNVLTGTISTDWDGKAKDRTLIMAQLGVDHDFIPNFKLKLLAGQNFRGTKADSTAIILNETAVKQTGLKDPIGKRFKLDKTEGIIIGVVKDFNITTIREPIMPLVIYSHPNQNFRVHVHTTGQLAPAALAKAEQLWKQYMPAYPFEYAFLDASYNALYRTEQQTGQLFNFFAGVAIVISCLGLLGLTSFTTEQRTKEIGIRKVLGATVLNITTLISKDFLKLVFIAIVIASPIAWFAMDHWLKDFAYKVELPWWIFLLAGLLAMITALITICFQSIKAATANPVQSIKAE